MNGTRREWLTAPLAQRLRRLRLLEDECSLPELDGTGIPFEQQETLLQSTQGAVEYWEKQRRSRRQITATELLIVLERMRSQPAQASPHLELLSGTSYSEAVAACALNTGRILHDRGRNYYAEQMLDVSINYMFEAQRELLFALSTGSLSTEERTEALGKFAVAVAFSSRWNKTSTTVLHRALEFHKQSISSGNQSAEAYVYLVELLAALFDETTNAAYLDEALRTARDHSLYLEQAELLLKRGILRRLSGSGAWVRDLQSAQSAASRARPQSGMGYVKQALVCELALSATASPCPLDATQIKLPYGFLRELPRISEVGRQALRDDVLDALLPMQTMLRDKGKPPNLVAHHVLVAILRDSVLRRGKNATRDSELIVEIAEASLQRDRNRYLEYQHVDALLSRALVAPTNSHISRALDAARSLVERYPVWPLPRVVLARTLTLDANEHSLFQIHDEATSSWAQAAGRVVESSDYRRSDLGGRSSVFAVEDARGDILTALVFKPVSNRSDAEREADHMALLSGAIRIRGVDDRFGVPDSLVIVELTDGRTVHVIERQIGTLLSELNGHAAAKLLPSCIQLTALFHNATESPDDGSTGWRKLRDGLKMWSRTLFQDKERAATFVSEMRRSLPKELPLVPKRDAHAGNWVVDSAGRLIAVDLEAGSLLPVGHDVAQLIEDCCLLPVSREGFARRRSLMDEYIMMLDVHVDRQRAVAAYDWFALYRSVWIASSASATKAHHTHARQLAQYLASESDLVDLQYPSEMLATALRQLSVADPDRTVDGVHRRNSKRLARVLRHSAHELGLSVDQAGFVRLEKLAKVAGLTVDQVLATATHPAEQRFEVYDGRVRALYGHSFPVTDLPDLDIATPDPLFHGTSWDALQRIASEGLLPMERQKVHLTNNASEALEVARRHRKPALLAVSTTGNELFQAVADAVWAADWVAPHLLEVCNPYAQMQDPPTWLSDAIARDSRDGAQRLNR